jgi:hypothetical protein
MANCASCGTKQSILKFETGPWQTLEGKLLCPDCAARLSDPVEQARAAKAAGSRLLQISLPVSQTTATVVAMVGAFASSTSTPHASVLDRIESEGWRLEHAAYVYRVTGSESRDKFLSSGQQEAVRGEIVGIYLFRST